MSRVAFALQGGGALGAYAFGALKAVYELERQVDPNFKPIAVSGVSIGAFTAAIVASHPEDPIPALDAFWNDLKVPHFPLVPSALEPYMSHFGNAGMYKPRQDWAFLPVWTHLYELTPLRQTLLRYVDLKRIATADTKLVVTATDIQSGEIKEFSNTEPNNPITIDMIIASGSLPPGFPAMRVGDRSYWDGGLFNNTPLGSLLNAIPTEEAANTRVIVINLFSNTGKVPTTMPEVIGRVFEIIFSNKTDRDIQLAHRINCLVKAVEHLQGLPANDPKSIFQEPTFKDLARYKVFEDIIQITNHALAERASASDFSSRTIEARIADGYRDAQEILQG